MRKQAVSRRDSYTIDKISLIIQLIALLSLTTVGLLNLNNTEYPLLWRDSFKMTFFILIGLVLQLLTSFYSNDGIKIGNLYDEEKTINQAMITCLIVVAIQVSIYIFFNQFVFQVTAIEVYAFFVSSAIAEESLYRAGIIGAGMIIFKKQIGNYYIRAFILVLVTSLMFVFTHQRYLGIPHLFWGTFLSGIALGTAFVYSKNPLVVIIAHALINFISSGSIVQTLM